MKVVSITKKKRCQIIERPEPKIAKDFVKVKIKAIAVCTEFKAYAKGTKSDNLGHEAAGEVVEVGPESKGMVQVGDRVVVMPTNPCGQCWLCQQGDYIHCQQGINLKTLCQTETGNATYAEYCIRREWQLIPIPRDTSYQHAVMACCGLGATFGAMQRFNLRQGETLLIAGLGPVGLGGVINGVSRGAKVIALDFNSYRRKLAQDLGATLVLDPKSKETPSEIRAFTQGIGVDKAIDCSGTRKAQRLLIDLAKRQGHVAFVGESNLFLLKISQDLIRKGLTLHGSWHYNLNDAPKLMQLISEQGKKLDKFITHTFPMAQCQDAWELQLKGNCGKIILIP